MKIKATIEISLQYIRTLRHEFIKSTKEPPRFLIMNHNDALLLKDEVDSKFTPSSTQNLIAIDNMKLIRTYDLEEGEIHLV
jgi:hypothetical protein